MQSSVKTYTCDVCVYTSKEKGSLVRHMKIHSDEKPNKCDVCVYACKEKSYLVIHRKTLGWEKL